MAEAPTAGVPARFDSPADAVEFRRLPGRTGVELYRARIVRHAFEPHAHDGFGLGVIARGAQRFRYRGADHVAAAGALVTMDAGELHTGQAATQDGWHYRMLYIEPAALEAVSGERGWHFPSAVNPDAARARRVARLLQAMWHVVDRGREPLAFDSLLARLLGEMRPAARVARAAPAEGALRFAPVLEYMRAHLDQTLTLEALAAVAGLSPFHFLRRFQAQMHATPQQMLMALRLLEAQRRLAAGERPAQVAAAAGLADQAHLTRAFARRYGVTPAAYQRQVRGG